MDLVKYPPLGSRAGAPGYGGADYTYPEDDAGWLRGANASTAVIAHIETAAGLERAAEIIATPHLDMVYVGPYDTAIALGHPGEYDHPRMKAALGTVLDLCLQHGVAFGTTPSGPAAAADWVARGLPLLRAGRRAGPAARRRAGGGRRLWKPAVMNGPPGATPIPLTAAQVRPVPGRTAT